MVRIEVRGKLTCVPGRFHQVAGRTLHRSRTLPFARIESSSPSSISTPIINLSTSFHFASAAALVLTRSRSPFYRILVSLAIRLLPVMFRGPLPGGQILIPLVPSCALHSYAKLAIARYPHSKSILPLFWQRLPPQNTCRTKSTRVSRCKSRYATMGSTHHQQHPPIPYGRRCVDFSQIH